MGHLAAVFAAIVLIEAFFALKSRNLLNMDFSSTLTSVSQFRNASSDDERQRLLFSSSKHLLKSSTLLVAICLAAGLVAFIPYLLVSTTFNFTTYCIVLTGISVGWFYLRKNWLRR